MTEVVSHTSLTANSGPFSLAGGIYQANCSRTIANGTDAIELQHLVGGSFVSLDPPIKFLALDKGGAKTFCLPEPSDGRSLETGTRSTQMSFTRRNSA